MLFDMRFCRQEIFIDEVSSRFIFVRLGVQPSTGPSCGCRTEIQKERTALFFCREQTLIYILAPLNCHLSSSVFDIRIVVGTFASRFQIRQTERHINSSPSASGSRVRIGSLRWIPTRRYVGRHAKPSAGRNWQEVAPWLNDPTPGHLPESAPICALPLYGQRLR